MRFVHLGSLAMGTCLIAAVSASAQERPQPEATVAVAERQSVRAQDFMIATAHPLATEAGHVILAAGGTAADAAVVVQTMLGLVEPQSSGLGGGPLLVHFDAQTSDSTTHTAPETTPRAATDTHWLHPGAP